MSVTAAAPRIGLVDGNGLLDGCALPHLFDPRGVVGGKAKRVNLPPSSPKVYSFPCCRKAPVTRFFYQRSVSAPLEQVDRRRSQRLRGFKRMRTTQGPAPLHKIPFIRRGLAGALEVLNQALGDDLRY